MILIHGAYGRHYTTAREALEAWNSGKDFAIALHTSRTPCGKYCSIRDWAFMLEEFGQVFISYGNDNFVEAK